MKHLLYLNRDYLYSYYAQAYDGIDHTKTKCFGKDGRTQS